MFRQALRDFLMLLVTVDPIERRAVARRTVAIAGGVLLAFLIAGEIVLANLGIRLVSTRRRSHLVSLRSADGIRQWSAFQSRRRRARPRCCRVSPGASGYCEPRRDHCGGVTH